jgi:hypothetical protein
VTSDLANALSNEVVRDGVLPLVTILLVVFFKSTIEFIRGKVERFSVWKVSVWFEVSFLAFGGTIAWVARAAVRSDETSQAVGAKYIRLHNRLTDGMVTGLGLVVMVLIGTFALCVYEGARRRTRPVDPRSFVVAHVLGLLSFVAFLVWQAGLPAV